MNMSAEIFVQDRLSEYFRKKYVRRAVDVGAKGS